jgi:parallel beta-helix repeat protein
MRLKRGQAVVVVTALATWWLCLPGGAMSGGDASSGRVVVVAQDGSGAYAEIQAAIDNALPGDTILVKQGNYREDVVVHSKDRLRLVGESRDQVTILGLKRVGAFRIGKWPYGANDIEVRDLTVSQNGGLAVGIFNGTKIRLVNIRVQGLLYVQQAKDVRIERSLLGGSETTGVSFSDAQGEVIGNEIRDNDYGVTVAGMSDVRIEGNIITNNLYDAVVFQSGSKGAVVGNRLLKNGGAISVQEGAQADLNGNTIASAP